MLLTAFPFLFWNYVKIIQNYLLIFQKYWYYYKDSSGNFCYNEYRTTTKTISTDYKLQEDDSWWNWQPLVPLLHLLQLCCCLLLAWPLAVWLWPQRRQTHQWWQQASKKKKLRCKDFISVHKKKSTFRFSERCSFFGVCSFILPVRYHASQFLHRIHRDIVRCRCPVHSIRLEYPPDRFLPMQCRTTPLAAAW